MNFVELIITVNFRFGGTFLPFLFLATAGLQILKVFFAVHFQSIFGTATRSSLYGEAPRSPLVPRTSWACGRFFQFHYYGTFQ